MISNSDLLIDSNVEKIKKKAEDFKFGKISSFDESISYVRFWLADYYKIPSKSAVFDEYTAEELFFEFYYLNAKQEQPDPAKAVRESANELADLFNKEFTKEENAAMDKIFENDVNWSLDDLKKG
jgi:hypothetical protein